MSDWYQGKPEIHGFFACITGNLEIAAKISALFSPENFYFPVIDPPRVKRPDASNEAIRRLNLLAQLHPKRIIFGNLSTEEKLSLVGGIPLAKIDNVETAEELDALIKAISGELDIKGVIECREDQVVLGLLLAKYEKKFIEIKSDAPDVDEKAIKSYSSGDHLVVLDDLSGINQVIAANYAFMLNGRIKILPNSPEEENLSAFEDIMDRDNPNDTRRGKRAERSLMSQQYKLDKKISIGEIEEKFVTFITSGFPYGYFFPEVPSTHLFSNPDLGLSVLKGLMAAYRPTNTALTIDPGHFKNSEIQEVNNALAKLGTHVKTLIDSEATVYKLGISIETYPYDLLFICSHAGQTDGQEFTIEISDNEGKPHTLVVEVADGFGLTGEGTGDSSIVEVKSHYGFVSMDGYDWSNPDRPKTKGVVENFMNNTDRSKWKIISRRDVPVVKRAVVLEMKDGNFIPMMHNLAGHESPLVFNNACITFNEFSERFIFAGAVAYIGTLVNISTKYAIEFAKIFFNSLDPSKPIPIHLWETQKKLNNDPKKYYYMHAGVFHTFINPADSDTTGKLKKKLEYYISQYTKKGNQKSEFLKKMNQYTSFLKEELSKL